MAGLFGNQTIRVIRERWASASQLGEELYAMFSGKLPMTTSAPITINNPTTVNGDTITNKAGDSTVKINTSVTNNGPVTNNGDVFNAGNTTIVGPKTDIIDEDGLKKKLEDYINSLIDKRGGGGGSGNGVLFGTVTGGGGKTYEVDCSMTGLAGVGTIEVEFPNLPDNDRITNGAFIDGIVLAGGKYYAQAPPPRLFKGVVVGGSGHFYSCDLTTIEGQDVGNIQVEMSEEMDDFEPLPAGFPIFPVVYSGGKWRGQPSLWA